MNTKTFCMHPCLRTAQFTSAAVATIALAMCTMPAKPAHGTPISFAALEWKLAAKEQVLIDPNDMMAIKGAIWDVPAQRRLERNMPWLEIRNDANSDANLTQFRMTIGDERFNFSSEMYPNYAVVSPSSDFLDVTFSSPNDPAAIDMDYAGLSEGDVLVVDFGGAGLPPGALVRIRIDLGIDVDHPELMAIWPHPDFRTVLFDMNGIDAWGPNPQAPRPPMTDDNAMVVGVFEKDGMVAVTPSTAFPDATVVGPQSQIFNQFFRSAKVMEGVDVFDVVAVIPEPSSMLLALVGMMGFGLVSQRRMVAGRRDDTSTTATTGVEIIRAPDDNLPAGIAWPVERPVPSRTSNLASRLIWLRLAEVKPRWGLIICGPRQPRVRRRTGDPGLWSSTPSG